jgi:hypothetical protein
MSTPSPAPGTPQTSTKAYVAAALTFVVLVLGSWIADDGGTSLKEFGEWVVAGIVGSGLVGVPVHLTRNKAKGLEHVGGAG